MKRSKHAGQSPAINAAAPGLPAHPAKVATEPRLVDDDHPPLLLDIDG